MAPRAAQRPSARAAQRLLSGAYAAQYAQRPPCFAHFLEPLLLFFTYCCIYIYICIILGLAQNGFPRVANANSNKQLACRGSGGYCLCFWCVHVKRLAQMEPLCLCLSVQWWLCVLCLLCLCLCLCYVCAVPVPVPVQDEQPGFVVSSRVFPNLGEWHDGYGNVWPLDHWRED